MSTFELPDLGEGLTEAEIVSWLVATGDEIVVDQPVVEVETVRATVEVPCPFGGTVTELHGAVGEIVAVGAPLISVAPARPSGAGGDPATTVPSTREAPDSAGGNDAADHSADSGAVLVGYGTGTGARPPRRAARGAGGPLRSMAIDGPPTTSDGPTRVVSPLVRRPAWEHGVDVSALRGSGENGLVPRRDVESRIAPPP